jgi:hypothetical protein
MKQLLFGGLAIFAGLVSLPADVSMYQERHPAVPDYRQDPRLESLKRFFRRTGCPVQPLSHVFLQVADRYKLDWRLLPSISFIESTGGKAARNNNLFGWDGGRAKFASVSAGIHTVGFRLAHSKLYRNKDLDEILSTYNPYPDYPRKVKSVMRRISPSPWPGGHPVAQ